MSTQKEAIEAGFLAVADSHTRLVHKTDGPCWSDSAVYVPLHSIEEGKAHDYKVCSKCTKGAIDRISDDDGGND